MKLTVWSCDINGMNKMGAQTKPKKLNRNFERTNNRFDELHEVFILLTIIFDWIILGMTTSIELYTTCRSFSIRFMCYSACLIVLIVNRLPIMFAILCCHLKKVHGHLNIVWNHRHRGYSDIRFSIQWKLKFKLKVKQSLQSRLLALSINFCLFFSRFNASPNSNDQCSCIVQAVFIQPCSWAKQIFGCH